MVICAAPPTVALMPNVTTLDPPASAAVALVVCGPAPGPSVRTVLAKPFASVVACEGSTEPPPCAAAHATETPGTGLPCASVTSTTCGVWSAVLTCPVRLSPENFAIVVAGPGVTVAVKYTGLLLSPADVAWSESVPTMTPTVQLPTWAIPAPFVVCAESVTEPLDVPGGPNVTGAPLTGLPLASRTITEGGTATAVPAAAHCWLPALTAMALAGPAVRLIALDVRSVKPGLVNPSVRAPTAPVILRSVNDATPEA